MSVEMPFSNFLAFKKSERDPVNMQIKTSLNKSIMTTPPSALEGAGALDQTESAAAGGALGAARLIRNPEPASVERRGPGDRAKACQFTRSELIQLLKDNFGHPIWNFYFFANVPGTTLHKPRTDVDDHVVRCLKCGCTIDEHPYHPPEANEDNVGCLRMGSLFSMAGCDAKNPRDRWVLAVGALFIALLSYFLHHSDDPIRQPLQQFATGLVAQFLCFVAALLSTWSGEKFVACVKFVFPPKKNAVKGA